MLSGETVHVLVTHDPGYEDADDVRVFASQVDAQEAWQEVFADAVAYTEVEGPDDMPDYVRGHSFLAPNGMWAKVIAVEVE